MTNEGVITFMTDTMKRGFSAWCALATSWKMSIVFACPHSLMAQQSSKRLLTSRQILCRTLYIIVKLLWVFLSPENMPRCSINQSLLHQTCRTGAVVSSERFLLKKVVSVLLFCLFLPLRGRVKALYVAVGIPETRGSKKKTGLSHPLFLHSKREKWPSCVTRGN